VRLLSSREIRLAPMSSESERRCGQGEAREGGKIEQSVSLAVADDDASDDEGSELSGLYFCMDSHLGSDDDKDDDDDVSLRGTLYASETINKSHGYAHNRYKDTTTLPGPGCAGKKDTIDYAMSLISPAYPGTVEGSTSDKTPPTRVQRMMSLSPPPLLKNLSISSWTSDGSSQQNSQYCQEDEASISQLQQPVLTRDVERSDLSGRRVVLMQARRKMSH
jgi:hypothetical protein